MRNTAIILVAALTAAPVQAQDLAAKIAASRGEKVTFTFAGRDGVCGNGESFNLGNVRHSYNGDGWECREGPVRVTLTRSAQGGARWSRIRTTVASSVPSGTEDLGPVPP